MRHLVIGQRQKAPNFSAFHWSPHGCLITIGQHFVTTRVVHLPKRTETSLITESGFTNIKIEDKSLVALSPLLGLLVKSSHCKNILLVVLRK